MKASGEIETGRRGTVCVMPDADILLDSVPIGTYDIERDEDDNWLDEMRGALGRAFGFHAVGPWRQHGQDWLIDVIEGETVDDVISHVRADEAAQRDMHWRSRIEGIASGLHLAGQLDAEKAIRHLLEPGEQA